MEQTRLPSASVVIPTLNRAEPLRKLLGDLALQAGVQMEILVADQSQPANVLTAESLPADLASRATVRILRYPPGVVAARNASALESANEILVYLDDDVRIASPDFLRNHLLNYLDPAIAAVCGQELLPPEFEIGAPDASRFASAYEEAEFFSRNSSQRREVSHLSTCNCSVRKEAWRSVGGFNPLFTGNSYGDDTDFALRLRAFGCRTVFDPTASVRHLQWRSGGLRLSDPGNLSSERDKYLSAWLLYFLHVPAKWKKWYLWHRILRKSFLLKKNVGRLGRWPGIARALGHTYFQARSLLEGKQARQRAPFSADPRGSGGADGSSKTER